jgi:hypothetical protein
MKERLEITKATHELEGAGTLTTLYSFCSQPRAGKDVPLLPAAYRDYKASANNPSHFCEVEKDRYFSERGKEVQDDTVLLTVLESNLEKH